MKKVFINSLPKAGTHLLARSLELLGLTNKGHLGSGIVLNSRLLSRSRRWLMPPIRLGYILGVDTPVEVSRSLVERTLKRVKPGDYCTGHMGYTSDMLYRLMELEFVNLLILRDPRAVLASFVPYVLRNRTHFLHNVFRVMSNEERYEAALNGVYLSGRSLQPLRLRCVALEPWIRSEYVLKIKFEDLVGKLGGGTDAAQLETLHKICHWIGEPEEGIPYVAERLFGSSGGNFRKGQVDSWREEIPEKILGTLGHHLSDVLDTWGYK